MTKNNGFFYHFDSFDNNNEENNYDDNDNDDDDDDDDINQGDNNMNVVSWDTLPLEVKKQIGEKIYYGALQNKQPYAHLAALIPEATPKILSALAASSNTFLYSTDLDDLQQAFCMLEQSQKYLNNLVKIVKTQMSIIQKQ